MLRLLYLLWEWDINTILIKFSEGGYACFRKFPQFVHLRLIESWITYSLIIRISHISTHDNTN